MEEEEQIVQNFEVLETLDLCYHAESKHEKHYLDIYQPKTTKTKHPVLFFVHGGGWKRGDRIEKNILSRYQLYRNVGRTFASQGFCVVCISYRLSGMRKRDYFGLSFLLGLGYFSILNLILWGVSSWVYPIDFSTSLLMGLYGVSYLLGVLWIFKIKKFSGNTEIKHPDHVTDVGLALKWVQNEIHKYNGDPNNIFLMGHSAGGHLVSLLALDPHYILSVGSTLGGVRGVIGLSGVYNFGRLKKGGKLYSWFYLRPLLGTNLSREILFSASPLTHARKTPFNFFLVTASKDMHLPKDADELAQRLRESGVQVERVVVKGFHHTTVSIFGSPNDDLTPKLIQWMHQQIRSSKGNTSHRTVTKK